MDKIEDFIKDNKEEFEYLELRDNDWEQLRHKMMVPPKKRSYWYWVFPALVLGGIICLMFMDMGKAITEENEIPYVANVGLDERKYFPELNLMNPDGESISVSELKGKVVLVEFWASYCMVCTKNHCYYFKPLYQTYREQGFEIYSVSTDSSAVNWVHAIEKDELDWIHVSDLMGENSPTVDEFDVRQLPTNYLLDQEGRIIAKNIDVHELEDTLSRLLAFN